MRQSFNFLYLSSVRKLNLTSGSVIKALSTSLLFGVAASFIACSDSNNEVAGGGPSGTEAGNAITAQIMQTGSPAAMARVKLIESESLDGAENAYTAETDSEGFVTLENVDKGKYTMEASVDGFAVQVDVNYEGDVKDLGKQDLQKTVYIEKTLTDLGCEKCGEANGTIKFRGLDHSAEVVDGKFVIDNLPAGELDFVFIPAAGESVDSVDFNVTANPGDSLVVKTPKDEPAKDDTSSVEKSDAMASLVFDDFEDGDNLHALAADYGMTLEGHGMWSLTMGDNMYGSGPISVEPKISEETASNPFLAIIEKEDGNSQVHFKLTFPDSAYQAYPPVIDSTASWASNPSYMFMDSSSWVSQWWVCLGVKIGKSGTPYDLSSVDSIAFDAWGDGIAMFELANETKASDSSSGVNNTSIVAALASVSYDPRKIITGSAEFDIPKTKTRIVFAMSDLLPSEADRKNVSMVAVVFHSDAEFFFDNLEFIGKDLQKMQGIWEQTTK
ncbi:MAG: carboxypeptidase-like regulatory domain-containing protein [Fibrobacter sp.]|nr:carboxypeptidase-like regulatory domain-containing protein [Fibrobacter sp.]